MTGLPWDASYHDGPAPWDTGQPQPAIVRLASEGGLAGPVLDAGCGTGENALHVAALGLPVLGVDVAETALAITRHIAFGSDAATMGAMADARNNRSLSPDIQPTQDVARLELRASDADRDRTAAVLGNALATGRLTSTEHAERLDAAYTATTLGQLATLTRDLPADDAAGTSMAAVDRAEVAARFSKVIRSGRWVAGRRTRLTSHFGALVVNLADAVLPGREITLEIDAFCGKLILTVPAGAHVIDEGGALFAKRAIYGRQDPGDADGPVIRLVGEARFSKVAVHRGHYDPHGPWRHW